MRAKLTMSTILLMSAASLSCGEGGPDTCMNCPPVVAVFEGVIAGNDGAESGTISLELDEDGSGSGSFRIGNGAPVVLSSVGTTGTALTASGGGFTFTGTVSGIFIDGSYTGGAGGLIAAAELAGQTTLVQFCAAHDAGGGVAGVFAFVYNTTTNAVRGAWTSGTGAGAAFKGIISGFTGDDLGVMSGHTGTVTILPDLQNGTVGGFYDFTASTGETGSLSGPECS